MRGNLAVPQFGIVQWPKKIDGFFKAHAPNREEGMPWNTLVLHLIILKQGLPIHIDMAALSKGTNAMEPASRIERNNLRLTKSREYYHIQSNPHKKSQHRRLPTGA